MAVVIYTGVFGHESVGSVTENAVLDAAGAEVATIEGNDIIQDGEKIGYVEDGKAFNAAGECVGHSEGDKICKGENGFDCIGHYDDVDNPFAVAAYCLLLEPEFRLY